MRRRRRRRGGRSSGRAAPGSSGLLEAERPGHPCSDDQGASQDDCAARSHHHPPERGLGNPGSDLRCCRCQQAHVGPCHPVGMQWSPCNRWLAAPSASTMSGWDLQRQPTRGPSPAHNHQDPPRAGIEQPAADSRPRRTGPAPTRAFRFDAFSDAATVTCNVTARGRRAANRPGRVLPARRPTIYSADCRSTCAIFHSPSTLRNV